MRYIWIKMKKPGFFYIFFAVCAFLAAGLPAFAQEASASDAGSFSLQSVGIFHDTLWLGNSDGNSAPSPVLSVWGVSLRFFLKDEWFFAPELALASVEYLYRDGVALPAEIEEANAVKTLDFLLGLPVLYCFRPAEDVSVFAGTGPTFSFKLPIRTYGEASAGDVGGYFMEKSRFIHWEATATLEWDFFESLAFCVRVRLIVPVYRLWDGDDMPIYDGLMAGGSFGLRLKL
jgi:hypothetical protein